MPTVPRCCLSGLLCAVICFQAVANAFPYADDAPLNIVIIEGDGAINNIKQRTAREPIVQVEDQNHKPVAGAAVLFELPQNGASASFAQGARTATFVTDQNGRVVAHGLRVNKVQGKFQIKVTASSQGRVATTTISQTNAVVGGAAAAGGLLSAKVLIILTAVGAAAAAGGIYAATHIGGGKSATTITPGSPGVGAPK
jgi:hypothetical protein